MKAGIEAMMDIMANEIQILERNRSKRGLHPLYY